MSSRDDRQPLVSVVIPVFNNEQHLSDAIDSALAQTYPHIEVVAVDDGSTDASPRILAGYGESIRVIRQANSGSAKARNAGIEASRGAVIAFLDADDLWHPDKTRIQVEHLVSRDNVGLVYSDWMVLQDDSVRELASFNGQVFDTDDVPIAIDLSGSIYSTLLLDCVVHTSSAMVWKSKLLEAGCFDEALRKGQDYDCWIRLSRITDFLKLDAVLSVYRLHDHGITNQPNAVNHGAQIITRALSIWGRTDPNGRAISRIAVRNRLSLLWLNFASLHFRAGSNTMAREAVWKSIGYVPWNISSWKLYIRSKLMAAGVPARGTGNK